MVGTCTLPLSELVADAPSPDATTGLYGKEEDGKHEMREFTVGKLIVAGGFQELITSSYQS